MDEICSDKNHDILQKGICYFWYVVFFCMQA